MEGILTAPYKRFGASIQGSSLIMRFTSCAGIHLDTSLLSPLWTWGQKELNQIC